MSSRLRNRRRAARLGSKLALATLSIAATLGGWSWLARAERVESAQAASQPSIVAMLPARAPLPPVLAAPNGLISAGPPEPLPALDLAPIPDLPPVGIIVKDAATVLTDGDSAGGDQPSGDDDASVPAASDAEPTPSPRPTPPPSAAARPTSPPPGEPAPKPAPVRVASSEPAAPAPKPAAVAANQPATQPPAPKPAAPAPVAAPPTPAPAPPTPRPAPPTPVPAPPTPKPAPPTPVPAPPTPRPAPPTAAPAPKPAPTPAARSRSSKR